MRQSTLFTKTVKETPKDETSINAQLLIRAGFVDKLMAGVYSYLPLGLRVLNKINQIIREEMNAIGGQELLMPALQPKELWDKTGRWEKLKDVMFQFKGRGNSDIGLAATHEEVLTHILTKYVKSYKDLPLAIYQIQNKFRNEPRAKSGVLRGRELLMKDLYSFHADEKGFEDFYEKTKPAYLKVYKRCGLDAKVTDAPGGDFTERLTHEFQVLCENGEDTILYCEQCDFSQNHEIAEVKEGDKCPKCSGKIKKANSIEVGNIFPLETVYSGPLELTYSDEKGEKKPVIMGSYGIGVSRVMGSIVEVHHDKKGIIWPEQVAPFKVHLLFLGNDSKILKTAEKLYSDLTKAGVEVLFDDREESAGVKLNDSDLLGLPYRLVISDKTGDSQVELKKRSEDEIELVNLKDVVLKLT